MKKIISLLFLVLCVYSLSAQEQKEVSQQVENTSENLKILKEGDRLIYIALMDPFIERAYNAFGRYGYWAMPGINVGADYVLKTFCDNRLVLTLGGHVGAYTTLSAWAIELYTLLQSKLYYQLMSLKGLSFYLGLSVGGCLRFGEMPGYKGKTLGDFIYDDVVGISYKFKNGVGMFLDLNPTTFIFMGEEKDYQTPEQRQIDYERLGKGLPRLYYNPDKMLSNGYGYSYFNLGVSFNF